MSSHNVKDWFCPKEITGLPTAKWDRRFLELARQVASWSKDQSTKCGCVLVRDNRILSTGYNGFPKGTEDYDNPDKNKRPEKYFWYEHSERNAIYSAAKLGVSLDGAVAYVTGPPCVDCTRAMVQVGIRHIIIPKQHNFVKYMEDDENKWAGQAKACLEIMYNAGIGYWCIEID